MPLALALAFKQDCMTVGWHAYRYSVRCGQRRQNRLGQSHSVVPPALHERGADTQDYSGYSVWQPDPRMPDFLNW